MEDGNELIQAGSAAVRPFRLPGSDRLEAIRRMALGLVEARRILRTEKRLWRFVAESGYADLGRSEIEALLRIGDLYDHLEPMCRSVTDPTPERILAEYGDAALAARMAARRRAGKPPAGVEGPAKEATDTARPRVGRPPKPASQDWLDNAVGAEAAAAIRAWYPHEQGGVPFLSSMRKAGRFGTPAAKALAKAVSSGACAHAKPNRRWPFDLRALYPHVPGKVADALKGNPLSRLHRDRARLEELDRLCAERSDYVVEERRPDGRAYRLRTPEQEEALGHMALRWWFDGAWPVYAGPLAPPASARADVRPDNVVRLETPRSAPEPSGGRTSAPEPQGDPAFVYFGETIHPPPPWLLELKGTEAPDLPEKEDVEAMAWLGDELFRMLRGVRGETFGTIPVTLRNLSKYIGMVRKPQAAAAVLRAMADAIAKGEHEPQREHQRSLPMRPVKYADERRERG
ncbi:hypothetical protein [Azospirillum sp. sgz301742]